MRRKQSKSFFGFHTDYIEKWNGKGIVRILIAVVFLIVVTAVLWFRQESEHFSLQFSDRSSETGTERQPENGAGPGEISENDYVNRVDAQTGEIATIRMDEMDFSQIRVVLYTTDYTSIYHEVFTVLGEQETVRLTAQLLRSDFSALAESCEQNGFRLSDVSDDTGQCFVLEKTDGENTLITSITRSSGAPSYRGRFYLYPENEKLVIVNELMLEEYLYGVLPSEMPASYAEEALKAQAVCARTFACRNMMQEKYPDYHAALDDSTDCQVYGNLPEDARTNRAVDDTKGMILIQDDLPASTFYYSTSCGLSGDASTWPEYAPEDFPYLSAYTLDEAHRQVDFSGENGEELFRAFLEQESAAYEKELPWFRWHCETGVLDTARMLARMKQRYQAKPSLIRTYRDGVYMKTEPGQLTDIVRVEIMERNAGGSAAMMEIECSDVTYRIYGEYNIRYLLCGDHTEVIRQDGSSRVMTSILPSGFFWMETILYNDGGIGYAISGGGYGHGVGLSQNGADCMAQTGMDYAQILAYYYMGTQVMCLAEPDE